MIRRDRPKALVLDPIRIDCISRGEPQITLRLKQELASMAAEIVFEPVRLNAARKVS